MRIFLKRLGKISLILFSLFLVTIFIFDSFVMPSVVKHDETVKVPNVVGVKLADAIKILSDLEFVPVQTEIRIDKNKPIGVIVSQNPLPNKKVKSKRRVYLTISGGEEFFLMPNIIGKSFREVKSIFNYYGIVLGNILHDTSFLHPKGTVKLQSIEPKSKINTNQIVDITLSFGDEFNDIITPNYVGKNIDVVEKLIINSGLLVGNISYSSKEFSKNNIVLSQEPEIGTIVNLNQKINLVVTKNE